MNKLLLVLALAASLTTARAALDVPKAAPDPTAELVKKLDEAKGQTAMAQNQVAQLQAQQQQQAIMTEYYKTLSERNEAIIRLNSTQAQVEALTKERDALKAKVATLEAPAKK